MASAPEQLGKNGTLCYFMILHSLLGDLPSRELTYPPNKAYLKLIFLFPRWDMLIPWRVGVFIWGFVANAREIVAGKEGRMYWYLLQQRWVQRTHSQIDVPLSQLKGT